MNRKRLLPFRNLHCVTFTLLVWSLAFAPHAQAQASPLKQIRLLHIADTHAPLDTHWAYLPEDPDHLHQMGGYARLRTALEDARAHAPGAVFTVDGGDTFQGSAIAAWTKGEAIVAPLNALHLDAGVPGNWEPVYGPEIFKKLMAEVNFPVICYNLRDTHTGNRLFAPATLVERGGVRIAVVGVTDMTTTVRQAPAEVRGLDSTAISGLAAFVREYKIQQHPDLTVLVDHTGLAPSVQIAHDIPEFDVVLSAHTHERVYKPILVGHTLVVEPGSMGSFFGQLDLSLQDGKVVDYHYNLMPVEASRYAENPEVKALVTKAEAPYRKRLDSVVGRTKTPLMRYDVLEATMDNVIADAVREAAHTDLGFTNGFRFSPPIAPGPITRADVWNALPLDARLKVGHATGAHIRRYLEQEMELVFAKDPFTLSGGWGPRVSGMEITFRAGAPKGERIQSVKIHGKELDPNHVYSLAGCERDGEEMNTICRMKEVEDAHYLPGTAHTIVETYIKGHSPLAPHREGRVQATDLPPRVWSQYGTLQKLWGIPGSAEGVAVPVPGTGPDKAANHGERTR